MKLLVLQHARVEHPGSFRKFLREDGHDFVAVELDDGEALPALDGFDALWVMGGPMDVWEEDEYPWLRDEKNLILEAVEGRGMPFLGLCLGHQLLAEALGGSCGASEQPEIGVMPVQLTEAGATSVILNDFPNMFDCLQWHSAEVKTMPEGAKCLASSPACVVQVMQWGPRATSLQFHLEVEPDTVTNWVDIPAYETALKSALGKNGPAELKASCDGRLAEFEKLAERVYVNWLQTAIKV